MTLTHYKGSVIMHKNDKSKVQQVVSMLNELGVKVKVSGSRFDMMKRISHKEKLRLKEGNI